MLSNEPKNEKGLKGGEEIPSSSSINDNNSSSSITNQETQNEQAELSEIETGNKGQPDFDEMISFNHTYLNYRYARCL